MRIAVKNLNAVQVKLIQVAVIGIGVIIGKKLIDRFDNKLPVKLRKSKKPNNIVKDNYQLISIAVQSQPRPWKNKAKVNINSMYGKFSK